MIDSYLSEEILAINRTLQRIQIISERHTPKDEYENFVTVFIEVAAECIPTKPRATSS